MGTTGECVVDTSDSQLVVGTDDGRLVSFNLALLDEGQLAASVYHSKLLDAWPG